MNVESNGFTNQQNIEIRQNIVDVLCELSSYRVSDAKLRADIDENYESCVHEDISPDSNQRIRITGKFPDFRVCEKLCSHFYKHPPRSKCGYSLNVLIAYRDAGLWVGTEITWSEFKPDDSVAGKSWKWV